MRVVALCLAAVVAVQCALGTSAAVATVWKSTAVHDQLHEIPVTDHRIPDEGQQGADRSMSFALDAQAQGTWRSLLFFVDDALDGISAGS